MLFSSLVFLYLFLPLTLLLVFVAGTRWRNYILLLMSLLFYAWGGVSYSLVMIGSIVLNYFMGLWVSSTLNNERKAKQILGLTVALNLIALAVFKYSDFVVENLNTVIKLLGSTELDSPNIKLPIGISFFTFHALSYVVDIYRGKSQVQRNFGTLALYISLFPQLVAGPIIRYHDVSDQLTNRKVTADKFASGIRRFIIGLAKKVLISNMFAFPADEIFKLANSELDFGLAWFGAICYSFHIYCDFSGYSDMAIGLGRMFGFEFLENFNFPYLAKSIQDFWRRWHISLSNFFRDYVYIPLGGNRHSEAKTYRNLFIVFFLTGLWHGASWTFIFWGLFHGLFLVIERLGLSKYLEKYPIPARIYTLLIVVVGWVFFRAETFEQAGNFIQNMFWLKQTHINYSLIHSFTHSGFMVATMLVLLGSFGFLSSAIAWFKNIFSSSQISKMAFSTIEVSFMVSVMLLCTLFLISDTYNPFIYFRF